MAEETHTDFEIAIERELHGALPEPEAKTLAEHLLECATCRAYQKTALEMEYQMNATQALLSQHFMSHSLSERINRRVHDQNRRAVVVGALFVAVTLIANFSLRHRVAIDGIVSAINVTLIMAVGIYRSRNRGRALRREVEISRTTGDLFAVLRRELEIEARAFPRVAIVGLALGAMMLVAALFVAQYDRRYAAFGILAGCMSVVGAIVGSVHRRRLLKQLDALR